MDTGEIFVVSFVCVTMVVGAVIDGWKLKVPNWLTFTMILGGWLYWGVSSGTGQLGQSALGAFVAGAFLLPLYLVGGMGAGDVKMYAGFGAWMVPLHWFGLWHLTCAFATSAVVGGIMAVGMIWWKKTAFVNLENVKDIVHDWRSSSSLGEIAAKAKSRKPYLMLLPYGIPLTVGSLTYTVYLLTQGVAGGLAALGL
jgi:prepilin peptidase CpaA